MELRMCANRLAASHPTPKATVMDENEVIEKCCIYLESRGWKIKSKVAAGNRGVDIIVADPTSVIYYIEAKGGTSSQINSPKYGEPYNKTKVFDVTSKGLMQCFHHLAKEPDVKVGFTYPAGKYFSCYMDPIKPVLTGVGLTLFCVHADGSVEVTSP